MDSPRAAMLSRLRLALPSGLLRRCERPDVFKRPGI